MDVETMKAVVIVTFAPMHVPSVALKDDKKWL